MTETLRIGASPYVSAWPLTDGLAEEAGVVVRQEPPSALGPLLKAGELQAALIPSIEYYRLAAVADERARVVAPMRIMALPVAAIGSRGAVGSVRLFGYAERERIRRVLLDSASRTANALVRLLLERPSAVQPHFVLPEELASKSPRPPDAEVVIGDAALVAARPRALWVDDLGEEWDDRYHKPLVWAFWAARADAPIDRLVEVLSAARDRGLAKLEELAARATSERGLPPDVARRFLCHQIRYGFGQKERLGVQFFYERAADECLAPLGVKLRFP
jgi:chorismate dehydratase